MAVLLTPLEKLPHKTEKFLLQVRTCWKFYKNTYPCHQTFPSDTWNPDFTKPPEKFRQKMFGSIKQSDEKRINSTLTHFWKCFYGHVKRNLDPTLSKKYVRRSNSFRTRSKNSEKNSYFFRRLFPPKCSSRHQ